MVTTSKFKIVKTGYLYTDYQCVFGVYKKKQYKIIAGRKSNGRIYVNVYLLTNTGYVDLFNETDLNIYVHDFYVKDNDGQKCKEFIQKRINHAIEFIETIY